MDVFVRTDEGCAPLFPVYWDSVWDHGASYADWALALPSESANRGGLRAIKGLETAVILALFTDKHCPANHPLAKYAGKDLRGYWGDGVDVRKDLGETELGSLLWLLERSVATRDMVRWAQAFALDALAPLIAQKAASRVTAVAALLPKVNGLTLNIGLYGQDGAKTYDRRFEVYWNQISPRVG